jgi:hypothetical protein
MALRLCGLPALPDWQDGMVRLVSALATEEELGAEGEQA